MAQTDVAGRRAGPDRPDPPHHRFVGDVDQPLRPARRLAGDEHPARVAVPAVDDQRHVDIENVAVAQRLLVGNAVTDDVVDRGADRFAIAAIIERGRIGVVVAGELEDEPVEAGGRHPRLDERPDKSSASAVSAPALRMPSEILGTVQPDLAAATRDMVRRRNECRRCRHCQSFAALGGRGYTYACGPPARQGVR